MKAKISVVILCVAISSASAVSQNNQPQVEPMSIAREETVYVDLLAPGSLQFSDPPTVAAEPTDLQWATVSLKSEGGDTKPGPDGTGQTITYDYDIDVVLTVQYVERQNDLMLYAIVGVDGSVRFGGSAEMIQGSLIKIVGFDELYPFPGFELPGTLTYSLTKNRVISAEFGMLVKEQLAEWKLMHVMYSAHVAPYFTRLFVKAPSDWQFDDVYHCGQEPHWVDFRTAQPTSGNISLTHNAGFGYNNDYQNSWRLIGEGASFTVFFDVTGSDDGAELVLRHLTSYYKDCPNEGYSPVTIAVNGTAIAECYDPAENHGFTHSFVTDRWDINDHLQLGTNTISLTRCRGCTHYWIESLHVGSSRPSCALCEFPARLESVEVTEGIQMIDSPPIVWRWDDPDPCAVAGHDRLALNLSFTSQGPEAASHHLPTIAGSYTINKAGGDVAEVLAQDFVLAPGWEGTVNIELPAEIDIDAYTLYLDARCIEGNAGTGEAELLAHTSVVFPLYVTFAEPRLEDAPPRIYLEKATRWARGPRGSVDGVLTRLMNGIYGEGQRQDSGWTYTYGKSERDSPTSWETFLTGDKKGNCEDLAMLWTNLAWCLGIAVQQPFVIRSAKEREHSNPEEPYMFLTKEPNRLVTFDGKRGNAHAEGSRNNDRWLFNLHVVGVGPSEEKYYDPTFNRPYSKMFEIVEGWADSPRIRNVNHPDFAMVQVIDIFRPKPFWADEPSGTRCGQVVIETAVDDITYYVW